MAALQDASVGLKVESTYGTGVTVDRFLEFTDESFDYEKVTKQGAGIRVGSSVARSGRRVVTQTSAKGDMSVELVSKGLGTLLKACMGSGTSTLVSGSTYQQLFTFATTSTPPSYTVQKGVVEAGGTVDPYTFTGGVVESFEINAAQGDIATLKSSWFFKDMATATAYATPSYVSSPSLFHFAQGAITLGGSVTVPTTTALGSGGTSVANVREFSLTVDHKLTTDRYNIGGSGKVSASPTYGLREIKGKMKIEYDSTTIRDAYLADTALAATLTFTSAESLSTGTATFQVVIPELKLDSGVPQANGTDLVVVDVDFTVLDNLTAAYPLYVAVRTADTAL